MRYRSLLPVILVVLGLTALVHARNGDNQTPESRMAYSFESYLFQSEDNGWTDFLVNLVEQGYVVVRHANWNFDDDPEGCTLTHLVGASNSGVLAFLHVHGNPTGAVLEVYDEERDRDDAFDAYVDAGWNGNGIEIAKADWWSGPFHIRGIVVRELALARRVKPQTDALGTIICMTGTCGSVGFIDDCGGRVQFGNDDPPDYWMENVKELLEHMSGFQESGEARSAADAFLAGTYDDVFVMTGEGRTTLCPSVLDFGPTGEVECEEGSVTGSVEFDTESSDLEPATTIIQVSANATLNDAIWSNPGFEISFEIGDLEVGETVTITLDQDHVRSASNSTHLDGNQGPPGSDGTRPNEDDFVWTFQCMGDADGDGLLDAHDNCSNHWNPEQSDLDDDGQGDVCDLDDAIIWVYFSSATGTNRLLWQPEAGFDHWNAYQGDLEVLANSCASGACLYTQEPGSNALARRECDLGLSETWMDHLDSPVAGKAAYFLVTGSVGGVQGSLGQDGGGAPRPNDHPCP